jgi:formylglycine-generating enzyme required for sulfatase activity
MLRHRGCVGLVVFVAGVFWGGMTQAQPRAEGGSSFALWDPSSWAFVRLVGFESVQKDLGLEGEALSKVKNVVSSFQDELWAELEKTRVAPGAFQNLSQEERTAHNEKMKTIGENLNDKFVPQLKDALTPAQFDRVQQIKWQADGSQALTNPDLAETLDLTKEQQEKIIAINQEYQGKMPEMRGGRMTTLAKRQELRKERDGKSIEVLTEDQQERYTKLLGNRFDFSRLMQPSKPEQPVADRMLGEKAGQVRDEIGLKMEFIWCPPGLLTMEQVERIKEPAPNTDEVPKEEASDSDDKTARNPRITTKVTPVKVTLTQGYWLGRHEVTQAEWKNVMKSEPWMGKGGTREGDDFPAMCINWDDAMEFCRTLTEREKKAGRLPKDWEYTLPTEAQWEWACRAGTETKFSFGDDESKLGDYAWFAGNVSNPRERYAHEVGQKKANPWGFFDMHGNVWEWCRDSYMEKLPGGRDPEVKPVEKARRSVRVLRGGYWGSGAAGCTSAYRFNNVSSNRGNYVSFRVALSLVQ